MTKDKLSSRGEEHVSGMMSRFKNGKLLRTSAGKRLNPESTKDVEQALGIAYSEARAGERRGFIKREWKNSIRMRPKKANA